MRAAANSMGLASMRMVLSDTEINSRLQNWFGLWYDRRKGGRQMDILTRAFYSRDTLTVARDLLGRDIVRAREDGKRLVCRITETEAYIGRLPRLRL